MLKRKMREFDYDIIIAGGGYAGSTLAISLLNLNPELRIAIIEKSQEFDQKIGESNSDLTAIFLHRLGIDHILKNHIKKTGLRFFFNEENSEDRHQVAEFSSPTLRGRNFGFHLDRKNFDQQLLEEAEKRGAVLYRPATVTEIDHQPFHNRLKITHGASEETISSKWLVDATGRARVVHRILGWKEAQVELKTGSVMTHIQMNHPEKWERPDDLYWNKKAIGPRNESTIHLMKPHHWWWIIKINEDWYSLGCVYDKTKVQVDDPEQFLQHEIKNNADLRLMFGGCEHKKVMHLDQLSYRSEKVFDQGVILLGDSAAFLDPLISPGLEIVSQQIIWVSEILDAEIRTGKYQFKRWSKFEKRFTQAYLSREQWHLGAYSLMENYRACINWLRLGNAAYFSFSVFPSILFKHRLKYPPKGSALISWNLKRLRKRLQKVVNRYHRKNRISYSRSEVRRSYIRFPHGLTFYVVPMHLILLWIADHAALICTSIFLRKKD